uniref:Uncharacterized protein n=1 Tax=Brassica campestris TaxID=3711 RepID=M4CNM0_BRACM
MNLDLIQDLPMLKFPSPIKIPSNNTNRDDDGSSGGCTTPTSSDHKIPPSTATTPPPPPQKRRPPPSPSCFIRSCKRKLLTPSKVEIIVNKDEIERFFSSVYNHQGRPCLGFIVLCPRTPLTITQRRHPPQQPPPKRLSRWLGDGEVSVLVHEDDQ